MAMGRCSVSSYEHTTSIQDADTSLKKLLKAIYSFY